MTRTTVLLAIACAALAVGCARKEPAQQTVAPVEAAAPVAAPPDGAALYALHCATCHMGDGSGVPFLQPSLTGSAVVRGDESLLIRVVLAGPAAVLPADRERYSNTMADFSLLTDAEIAALLTHVRREFGEGAPAVEPRSVAALRAAR